MFRGTTEGKKILLSKWNEHNKNMHHKNLKNIKGQVDTACPATYGSLKRKPKKEQLIEERFTEIERENRILLDKMSQIVNSRHNRPSSSTRRKSLNIEARKRQNMRIVTENQALLKRLQGKQPSYSVYKWEEERKNTEKRLRNICEFPYTLGAYDETLRKSSENRSRQNSRSRTIVRASENTTKSSRKQSAKSQKKTQIVYKKGMSVGEKHFIVEIQKKNALLVVLAFDIESPESFCLEITSAQAMEIMGGNENYSVLVNMLALENGELILIKNKKDMQRVQGFEIGECERKGELDDLIKECESVFHRKSNTVCDGRNDMESWLGVDIGESGFRGGNVNQLDKYSEDEEYGIDKEINGESDGVGKDKKEDELERWDENIISKNSNKDLERGDKIEKNSENFFNDRGFEEKPNKLFFEPKHQIDEFDSEEKVFKNMGEIEQGKKNTETSRKSSSCLVEIEENKLKASDSEDEIIENENKNDLENSREHELEESDSDQHTIKIIPSEKNSLLSLSKDNDVSSEERQQTPLKSQDSFHENYKEELIPENEENLENLLIKIEEISENTLNPKEKKAENIFQKLEKLEKISEKSLENMEKSSDKSLEKIAKNSEKSLKIEFDNSTKSLEILDKSMPKKTNSLTIPNNQSKDLFYNPINTDSPLLIEEESKLKHLLKKSETEKGKASKSESSDDENHILRKFESSSDEDYYSYSDSDDSPYEVSERFVPKNNFNGKTEAKISEIHSNNIRDSNPVIDFKSYPNSPYQNYSEFQEFNRPLASNNNEEKSKTPQASKSNEIIKKNSSKSSLKSQASDKSQNCGKEKIHEKDMKMLSQIETIDDSSAKIPFNELEKTKNDIKSKDVPHEKIKRVTIKDEKMIKSKKSEQNRKAENFKDKYKDVLDENSENSDEVPDEGIANDVNDANDLVKLKLEGRTDSLLDYSVLGPIPEVVISMAEDPVKNPYTSKFSYENKLDDQKIYEVHKPDGPNN